MQKPTYKDFILDLSIEDVEPDFLFSVYNTAVIPKGELVAIKGKAKQGKSQLAYLLSGALLSNESGVVNALLKNQKTLIFDTEQSQTSIKECVQRALRFAGRDENVLPTNFTPFFLRPLTVAQRRSVIEDAIDAEKPDVVFIDGIRDLLNDFNDIVESNDVIQWLLSLIARYKCSILCIIHQNKSKFDSNMRGHLGTELLNKSSDCFELQTVFNIFNVRHVASRNIQAQDFRFIIDENGCFREYDPAVAVSALEAAQEVGCDNNAMTFKRYKKLREAIKICFKDHFELSYTELTQLLTMAMACSEPTAKRQIAHAKKVKLIYSYNNLYRQGEGYFNETKTHEVYNN